MILKNLLANIEYELIKGNLDEEITDIVYDSRKAANGAAFVCISGSRLDSHEFIPDVISAGVKVIIISKDVDIDADVTVVKVTDSRYALAIMSANLFDHPASKMKTIGITGTKGKTSATHILKEILEADGRKVGLIGTNGVFIDDKRYKTVNTTPESYELQKYFSMMVNAGCEYMIMEVSSQAIMMNRVAGISYDIGAFLNISTDHIGPNEHASFEEYLSYKAKLLTRCNDGFVFADDENFEGMTKGHTCKLHTFGFNEAEFCASNIEEIHSPDFMGSKFLYKGIKSFEALLDVPGLYNVANALAAMSIADFLGVGEDSIKAALLKVKINGRMEVAHTSEHCTVIIDYAHNGVGTRSLLKTLRNYNPKRLVVVFGCGGDRAKDRRYEMGEAVGSMADFAIITTDNPRYEDPKEIVADIRQTFDKAGGKCIEIEDRREAIYKAISECNDGDMIAIIGKGHEDYQEIRGERTHLLDAEEVAKAIEKLGW